MAFKYDRLWSLLDSKGMSKAELRDKIKASQTTIVSLGRNKNVSLDVIDRICNELDCQPEDVFEYVPDVLPEPKIEYRRGEIFYADLSPVVGSEQGGLRPVLIIQNDIGNRHAPTIIVSPVTSQIDTPKMPTHVGLVPDEMNNLPKKSVIMLEQIRTIDNRRLKGKLGEISADEMEKVEKAILVSFGISNKSI